MVVVVLSKTSGSSAVGSKGEPGSQMEATHAVKADTSRVIPATPALSTPRSFRRGGKAVAPRTPTRADMATRPPSKDSSTHCMRINAQVMESKPNTVI